jgi:hypothetical protein
MLLLLAHRDQALRAAFSDLMERLATTDRLHGDPGLELGAMGTARWLKGGSPLSGAVPRLTGERWTLSRKA